MEAETEIRCRHLFSKPAAVRRSASGQDVGKYKNFVTEVRSDGDRHALDGAAPAKVGPAVADLCDLMQGYLLSSALPADQFRQLVQGKARRQREEGLSARPKILPGRR
jgi:hypothetical protein